MGKIAFIIGESFIYWQSLILMLGAATAEMPPVLRWRCPWR